MDDACCHRAPGDDDSPPLHPVIEGIRRASVSGQISRSSRIHIWGEIRKLSSIQRANHKGPGPVAGCGYRALLLRMGPKIFSRTCKKS